jgi:hypothetical protein
MLLAVDGYIRAHDIQAWFMVGKPGESNAADIIPSWFWVVP